MTALWRTGNAASRLRLALGRGLRLAAEDGRQWLRAQGRRAAALPAAGPVVRGIASSVGLLPGKAKAEPPGQAPPRATTAAKPVVFASACVGERAGGGWRHNGGIKQLNCLVALLRRHGFEAYIVTHDGSYEPWLLEHQPHLSMRQFAARLECAPEVRCITSWAKADAFIDACPRLYFWDMELAYTEHEHFRALARLYRKKIAGTAAISRTIQAWHMAHFRKPCALLPPLLDETVWFPADTGTIRNRIGYMNEGAHTDECVNTVRARLERDGLRAEFHRIAGEESEVLEGMRSCGLFLSLNPGKDPLWGEGSPITVLEALSAGCVVIAFDVLGNRELLHDGFNGRLVPRGRPDLMAEAAAGVLRSPSVMDAMRRNARLLLDASHTMASRWASLAEFLDLPAQHAACGVSARPGRTRAWRRGSRAADEAARLPEQACAAGRGAQ